MWAGLSDLFNNDKDLVRAASCILFDAETQFALVAEFGICLTFVVHFDILVVSLCPCFVAAALCARFSALFVVAFLRFGVCTVFCTVSVVSELVIFLDFSCWSLLIYFVLSIQ